jgi:cytoskeletal protein CcmA (bactofilin family)
MFSKAEGASGATPSIIASDVTITGDLITEGDIQMDGLVCGDVQSRTLTIGEKAQVEGTISAKDLRVFGAVIGQVTAESVALNKGSKVMGDITHHDLTIEQGATLEGNLRRMAAPKSEQPKVQLSAISGDDQPTGNGQTKPDKA